MFVQSKSISGSPTSFADMSQTLSSAHLKTLFQAASDGDQAKVAELLDGGIGVNEADEGGKSTSFFQHYELTAICAICVSFLNAISSISLFAPRRDRLDECGSRRPPLSGELPR